MPPHPSGAVPQAAPACSQVRGWQAPTPHCHGPAAPQVSPSGQLPHWRVPPHPSDTSPHSALRLAQVAGRQASSSGAARSEASPVSPGPASTSPPSSPSRPPSPAPSTSAASDGKGTNAPLPPGASQPMTKSENGIARARRRDVGRIGMLRGRRRRRTAASLPQASAPSDPRRRLRERAGPAKRSPDRSRASAPGARPSRACEPVRARRAAGSVLPGAADQERSATT